MSVQRRVAEPGRTVRHAIAWGGVVVLHGLLWAALTQRPVEQMPLRPPQWVTLRLLPALAALAPPVPARLDAPVPRLTVDVKAAQPNAAAPPRAAGPILATPAPGPQPITLPAEPPQATASQAPLDLVWHRPARRATEGARDAAIADPRANTARATPVDRMARTLGSDTRLIEEARADGTVRVRQGSTCVDLKLARASQLFPFDQSTRPSPRLVEACD